MTSLQQHYKERDPLKTVQLITDFFVNRGYTLKMTSLQKSEAKTWTCHVEIFKDNIKIEQANGKGITKEYCLASGYAELYERFCNHISNTLSLTFMTKYAEESKIKNNFIFSSDEKEITYEEIMSTPVINNFYGKLFNNNKTQIQTLFNTITDNNYIGVKYYNLVNPNNSQYYEPRILYRVLNTIGLSAGNSLNEALNQAISEICEVEITEYFFSNKNITYTEINLDILSEDKRKIIEQIQKAGFKIKILDLSYIFNTPVVASLLINPYQVNCQFNFGAFPVFEIAVERVLTELYQGIYSYLNTNQSLQIPSKVDYNKSMCSNNITGLNRVPEGFFNNLIISDNYNTKVFIDDMQSNETILNYYINLMKSRHMNICYRDNSLSDKIYAVSVVIPEILFKNNLTDGYSMISENIKNDILIFLMRQKKQINEMQKLNFDNIDILYNRMQTINEESKLLYKPELGELIGRISGGDIFTPTYQFTNNIMIPFLIPELNNFDSYKLSFLSNSIYYEPIKEIITIQNYVNSNLYTKEEIVNIFKIYDKDISIELIENCFNNKYLFLYCFIKPYYEYYHSNTYKEIIHSFIK